MHAAISAQRLSHIVSDHHHPPLPELNARPAAKKQHRNTHTGGEEALQTPDKKAPLTNTKKLSLLIIQTNMDITLKLICITKHNITSTLYTRLHTHSRSCKNAPNIIDTNTLIVA